MSSSTPNPTDKLEKLHHNIQLEGPEVANLLQLEGNGLKRLCPVCQGERARSERARDFVAQAEASADEELVTWAGKRIDVPDDPAYTLSINPKGFTCNSCGLYGDLVDLVRIARKCTEHDALIYLARHDGLDGGEASVDEVLDFDQRVSEDFIRIYEDFIDECRVVPDKTMPVLKQWGITRSDAEDNQVRYRPRDYRRAVTHLFDHFNVEKLTDAGILRDTSANPEDSADSSWFDLSRRGTLYGYHQRGIPYLVVPYLLRDRPIYFKAQPLISPARLQQLGAPYYIATARRAPCPYNADVLRNHDKVVVTRGELDALGIAAQGYPAIAIGSFSNFDEVWYDTLADKDLLFVLSPRAQKDPRLPHVVDDLRRHGLSKYEIAGLPGLDELMHMLGQRMGPPEAEIVG